MKLKKILALLMAGAMSASLLTGCGGGNQGSDAGSSTPDADTSDTSVSDDAGTSSVTDGASTPEDTASASDLEYVKGKGSLVVGITDFAPMDYKEEGNDEWIGFDADMAKAFAESIGVQAEFIEINWDNKIMELDSKGIDAVWNGMTLTDEVKTSMNCSVPYCQNVQVVVLPSDKADQYTDVESLKELNIAVESGSAGEAVATSLGLNATAVQSQANALMEVSSGASDACVIDVLMAAEMTGEGTNYADLTSTLNLTSLSGGSSEEYVVGFRKDSDLTDAFNEFYKTASSDGTVSTLAETYGIQESVIAPQ